MNCNNNKEKNFINYSDLYERDKLLTLDHKFLNFLKNKNLDIYYNLLTKRKLRKKIDFTSKELIDLSRLQEEFIIKLFKIDDEFNYIKYKYSLIVNLFQFKRNFIHRNSLLKYKKDFFLKDLSKFHELAINFEKSFFTEFIDYDLQFFNLVSQSLDHDEKNIDIINDSEIYAAYRVYFRESDLFSIPKKLDFENLIDKITKDSKENFLSSEYSKIRDGIKYLPYNKLENHAKYHVNYCINCHETKKDSCKDGLKKNDIYKINPLGNILKGCPLEQKISEMNLLAKTGNIIAALSIICIDNPLVALTGYRICNDCSKSCIFQKQDPVDIPSIETMILNDILKLPYGFEIYSLLTRWQIFDNINFIPAEIINKDILVVGLGPSGIAISHYMLNLGVKVTAIDALNIQKIPDNKLFSLIKDYEMLLNLYNDNKPLNFGGVAEYGITERWDKIKLVIIMLLLFRRENFKAIGGIRFGSNITYDEAINYYKFDHITICAGSGKPYIPVIENIDSGNIRTASDFLMSLHLGNMDNINSVMDFQIRIPAYIIGGGLTAIDAACELLAYYPIFVKKYYNKYNLKNLDITKLSKYEKEIIDEIIFHNNLFEEEYKKAISQNRDPNYVKIINKLGGVNILYRSSINESPAYKTNHEEIESALKQGVNFFEKTSLERIFKDENGNIFQISIKNKDISSLKNAKFLLLATGLVPLNLNDLDINIPNSEYISILGDMDKNYTGSVVKALASAKNEKDNIFRKIINSHQKKSDKKIIEENNFVAKIISKEKLFDDITEITLECSENYIDFKPGQYFKIQPYDLKNNDFEPIPLSGINYFYNSINDFSNSKISFVIKEKGFSSKKLLSLNINDKIRLMGGLGMSYLDILNHKSQPSKRKKIILIIAENEKIISFLSLIIYLSQNQDYQIIFIAIYDSKDSIFKFDVINTYSHMSEIIYLNNQNYNIIISKIIGLLTKKYNDLDFDSIFLSVNIKFSKILGNFFTENNEKKCQKTRIIISSTSLLQCMMQGVCGRCFISTKDNNEEKKIIFSCICQYSDFDNINLDNLNSRLNQNSLLEKLS